MAAAMHDRLWQHEQMRRELDAKPAPVCLPLMTRDQPDTAERKRLEVQRIPFALPERKQPQEA